MNEINFTQFNKIANKTIQSAKTEKNGVAQAAVNVASIFSVADANSNKALDKGELATALSNLEKELNNYNDSKDTANDFTEQVIAETSEKTTANDFTEQVIAETSEKTTANETTKEE